LACACVVLEMSPDV
ncbi:MAG: hypothetical protein V4637_15550, partial [Pseudomonadota bacterium]